ncbi:ACP S-malonyltransferase [Nocardia goodfellowii]|uniref:Malonyl CoA-acyl carrier protein transacylase n=1 Tax=Nocardia goodfellowii TaxID=882446 RepID=A0ABS4QHI9_9NOCA|nr:ACP S-malonyltransferase [Nocardia goodfellowii]MBP2191157.1 [acyl-carrier-protein] S-malonyltransferase [Nocardia goodfellowii]
MNELPASPTAAPRSLGLFPGQGSQRPGMAAWITDHPVAEKVLRRADEILGIPLRKLCTAGTAAELRATDVTQPAVVATSLALMAVRRQRGWTPAAVAGHSLGEFTALAIAGVLDEESVLRLVRRRGELMAEVSARSDGAMSAVIGLPHEQVETLCATVEVGLVAVANYNQPAQTVVSGHTVAVAALEDLARAAGALKVVRLKVGGPFHCALMGEIADEFGAELDRYTMRPPTIPVFSAVTADHVDDPAQIRALLRTQLVTPVRWVETIRRAVSEGYDELVELGPGQVLTGFSRRIAPSISSMTVSAP